MIFHQPHNSLGNYNYNFTTYRGTSYAPHFHQNFELIYVKEGNVTVAVSGVKKILVRGEAALVLSHQIHAFDVPLDACAWVAVFSEEYVPRFASAVRGKQGCDFVFRMRDAVCRMLEETLMDVPSDLLMKKAGFYAAVSEYLSSVALEKRSDKNDLLIGKILDFVAENFKNDIGMKEISEKFGYEYHYLSRLLNQKYGIDFRNLLVSYRLEAAKELLETRELPMTLVAEKSGFQSLRAFNHAFLHAYGISPGKYRP